MGGVSMEWKEVTLGEIAIFKTGKLNSNAAISNGEYPFFTCSPETLRINSYAFDQEAILLAGNNAEGNFSIKYYKGKFNAYQRTYVITPIRGKVDIKFLYYALSLCLKQLKNMSQGTSTKFLTVTILNSFSVKLPSISDQRRIASILSSLDRKIELNNKINADLEEMAQTIFKNWFVDFEPFKDGKFVDSELGMIPEGWKVGTLDEIFSLKYGKNLSTSMILEKGDYPVYGANGIIGYYNEYNCDKYSVLVTSRGNGSGDVSRTHHPKSFITNNSFVVEPLEQYKYIELPFINGLFNIIDFKSYCSGSAQPQLTNKAMRNICIISPPMEIVIKYCEMLETLFSHIECVIAENSHLSLLRDTLLPRLMSGELEVPE